MSDEPTIGKLFDLSDKVALITGASGYLGSAMSRALAEAGASVVTGSRDAGRAASTADQLPTTGSNQHVGIVLDQQDVNSVEAGFATSLEHLGRVDILVNNGQLGPSNDLTDVTPDQFQQHMSNAAGYFHLARLVRNHAVSRGAAASVIMLGSMYGVVGSYPDAYRDICTASPVAYHALKGGIIHMTRHLAVYWAADRVRVNCLSPGAFPNPQKVPDGLVERLTPKCPLGRMGVPHELKGAVVFLASDASSYMTGQNMIIDGGWTAW